MDKPTGEMSECNTQICKLAVISDTPEPIKKTAHFTSFDSKTKVKKDPREIYHLQVNIPKYDYC